MILIKPSFEILQITENPLQLIELSGRTCYKSEDRITPESNIKFCQSILSRKHESVIEHAVATVKLIVDRGVSHELVRHRLASYSQESTRYCNYKTGITFIIPPWVDILPGEYNSFNTSEDYDNNSWMWGVSMIRSEQSYLDLLSHGWTPQQSRSVLPNSLKTEIVTTANLREWRHIFNLRCDKAAHPQMREIMIPLREEFQRRISVIFNEEKNSMGK